MTPGPNASSASRTLSPATVSRIVWAVLWLVPFAVLLTAARLTPSPLGHGTHTQLGIPPCGFFVVTGLPCPGCGMTTAFAHAIRGQLVDAVRANPFGFVVFAMTCAWMPVATLGFARGLSVLDVLDRLRIDKWGLYVVALSMVTWGVRVVTLLWLR